jgi:hypothetical protein
MRAMWLLDIEHHSHRKCESQPVWVELFPASPSLVCPAPTSPHLSLNSTQPMAPTLHSPNLTYTSPKFDCCLHQSHTHSCGNWPSGRSRKSIQFATLPHKQGNQCHPESASSSLTTVNRKTKRFLDERLGNHRRAFLLLNQSSDSTSFLCLGVGVRDAVVFGIRSGGIGLRGLLSRVE